MISACAIALASSYSMIKEWRQFNVAGKEVARFNKEYPGLVMGVSDASTYHYSYLRVLLDAEQIDYPGYMDLQFAGVTDKTMAAKMSRCDIGSVLMPLGGLPFSINNNYTDKPLFSDDVRRIFDAHYAEYDKGSFYSVYICHRSSVR